MTEYIIEDLSSNIERRFFTTDISPYINNSNYFIINTDLILSYPIGCYQMFTENNSNYFLYNSNLSIQDKNMYINHIRTRRDELLKSTDYLMLDDINFDYKVELKEYRQYLRDLPNDINSDLINYYNIHNRRLFLIDKCPYFDLDKFIKKI